LVSNPSADASFTERALTLIEEYNASDLKQAERLVAIFRQRGKTDAGYPRIRPPDCQRVVLALREVFERNVEWFQSHDVSNITRFDQILTAFAETDIKAYPRERLALTFLQVDVKWLLDQPIEIERLLGHWAERPYAAETDFDGMVQLVAQNWKMHLSSGDVNRTLVNRSTDSSFMLSRVLMLVGQYPGRAWYLSRQFGPSLSLGKRIALREGVLAFLVSRIARIEMSMRRERGTPAASRLAQRLRRMLIFVMGLCLVLRSRFGDFPRRSRRAPKIIVTRAMGGIGDFLMMTPGLRALARRQRHPVKFVIPKPFFDIFIGSPNVELADIDGPPIDLTEYAAWANLTVCPAATYESRVRPHIKKGRIELFARGMGVTRSALLRHGTHIEVHLNTSQIAFREKFVSDHGLGKRPIVGIQPYSRELYKDHGGMDRIVEALAKEYDIIVFHHLQTRISSKLGLAATAGLSLANSLALVSALDAMVSVDSSFLHAASAFDVPVVALVGPTDGRVGVIDDRNVTLLSRREEFPCSPCWRNEDIPCAVTGKTGLSPCLSAITPDEVCGAVLVALRNAVKNPRRPSAVANEG
jgi:ADP-heptose:LPS heptosyltransferase